MKLELFPYQEEGAAWLVAKRLALLADKQRLGKSAQAIAAADLVGARRILVICRAVARSNWKVEFEKWSKKSRSFIFVEGRKTIETPPVDSVVITSYEGLPSVLGNPDIVFDVAIGDELHYCKSLEAKRTQNVLGKKGICRRTKYFWGLTGTPTPNHAGELWPVLFTFGATSLRYSDFISRFCLTRDSGFGLQIVGTNTDPNRIAELQGIMKKVVLRRTEEDVQIELPKVSFSTVMVEPGRVHLAATQFHKFIIPHDRTDEFMKIVEAEYGIIKGIVDKETISDELLEVLKAQSKSVSTLRRYTALQKLEPACELIREELAAGAYNKVVIFAHHRDIIEGARIRLAEFHPVTLYGGSNPLKVEQNLKNFQNPNHRVRVFIGNINAAGTSIELSVANHIFFLEEDWVPGNNAQAAMRCGGVNQKKPIFVRNFCLNNSIDQKIQEILRNKMRDQALIYDEKLPPKPNQDISELF